MPARDEAAAEDPPLNGESADQTLQPIRQAAADIALRLTPAVEQILAELQQCTQAESEKIVRDYEARFETLDKEILPLISEPSLFRFPFPVNPLLQTSNLEAVSRR
jgi:hypothetical protein